MFTLGALLVMLRSVAFGCRDLPVVHVDAMLSLSMQYPSASNSHDILKQRGHVAGGGIGVVRITPRITREYRDTSIIPSEFMYLRLLEDGLFLFMYFGLCVVLTGRGMLIFNSIHHGLWVSSSAMRHFLQRYGPAVCVVNDQN